MTKRTATEIERKMATTDTCSRIIARTGEEKENYRLRLAKYIIDMCLNRF